MNLNSNLHRAKEAKDDEFYTRMPDIVRELCYYREAFKGKTVYCSCDDPSKSKFYLYFSTHFDRLGLSKLICTHYDGGRRVSARVVDAVSITDVPLKCDGDFRSPECLAYLDQCDVVVTNPPFSLFREFMSILMERGKSFLIVGNKNAVKYKDEFTWMMEGRMWLGKTSLSSFDLPDGTSTKKVNGLCRWFTNIDHNGRHEPVLLIRTYNERDYPKYDNYEAIEVGRVEDIPRDYPGIMGVPITFLDRYCPDQFEILGLAIRWYETDIRTKRYTAEDDPGFNDLNASPCLMDGGVLKPLYPRILIRRR